MRAVRPPGGGRWVLLAAALAAAAPLAAHEAPEPGAPTVAGAGPRLDPEREIRPFATEVAGRHRLAAAEVERVLAAARVLPEVLRLVARPAEAKPWRDYRPIFVTERRIAAGRAFRAEHRALLERARARYGVPPEIVTAIIGVETFYGQRAGRLRVLDALATLAFRYPRRAEFFRRELEEFVVLATEESLDPMSMLGSYAGAMGIPQFIASSYRRYAVDFDGDGRRDLAGSVADAIGSVGSYLARHGWRRGQPVARRARAEGEAWRGVAGKDPRPRETVASLRALGVRPEPPPLGPDLEAALIELEGESGPELWLGLRNFYVITRYNHSALYAMAVHQLARAIAAGEGTVAR